MAAHNLDGTHPEPRDDSERFRANSGSIEFLKPAEGFSGAISLPLLPDLIQIYTVALASGALTIRRGTERGTIWFEHGQMVHAVCGDITGEEAVHRLLQWHRGDFALDAEAIAPVHTITSSWQNVLMEGLRLLDEQTHNGEPAAADVDFAAALSQLQPVLGTELAIAVYDRDGALIAADSRIADIDLSPAGPELVEMLRRHAAAMESLARRSPLRDCFWTLGEQVHFIQPLANGRLFYLVIGHCSVNLAVLRRAVDGIVQSFL